MRNPLVVAIAAVILVFGPLDYVYASLDQIFCEDPLPESLSPEGRIVYNTFMRIDAKSMKEHGCYLHTGVDVSGSMGDEVFAPVCEGDTARIVWIDTEGHTMLLAPTERGRTQGGYWALCLFLHVVPLGGVSQGDTVFHQPVAEIDQDNHLHEEIFLVPPGAPMPGGSEQLCHPLRLYVVKESGQIQVHL